MDRTAGAPTTDVLAVIRARCAEVAAQADLVRVDEDRLVDYLGELDAERAFDVPVHEDPWAVDQTTDPEARAALVLTLATVNFGSGYHPVVRKRPGLSGARTMARGIRDWAERTPITASRLARVTPTEAHEIFDQPVDDGPISELMGLFAAALDDLGNLVQDEHGNSFLALIDSAGGRASSLVTILDQLPFYRDVAPYRGRIVPFYKRAQLAACDLDRAFAGAGPGAFTDLDQLTAFADNLVPHVLRVDGVLRFDADLAATIDAGELLAAGSEAEVEIRALGIHAVERLSEALAERGRPMRPADLDLALWWRGSSSRYKAVPRHRSRTVFY